MTGTISVVPFKMNVLQQSTTVNVNDRRDVIIIRKPSPNDDILITNTARKKSKKDVKNNQSPLPLAVARRNARERNRVKQVNNGFATLRQHIPNSIAAAFENNNGRGGNKKLSKVETLRMAVEYIRSLEDMLASDGGESNQRTSSVHGNSFAYLLSPSIDDDDLSTNPTPPPQTYVRINGTNAYQMIPTHLYENSENLDPILTDPSLIDADLEFGDQDLSLLNSMETNESLSPEMYSDHSLSPSSIETANFEDIKIQPSSEDHKENMIHVMAWWEQQQVTTES